MAVPTVSAKADAIRQSIIAKYQTILGRNKYSQERRSYVFTKYSDGKYYSDCSSSIAACYRECGYPIKYGGTNLPNTAGMYLTSELTDVPVSIKNGIVQNPEVLRVGDLLLFAGTDPGRSYAGYVGHVEMVAKINGSKITIYGHGSGTPRATDMNNYCKSRFSQSSKTKLGHRGLIKVRRRIQDDTAPEDTQEPIVTITNCNSCNIRTGPGTQYPIAGITLNGVHFSGVNIEGWTPVFYNNSICWISNKYTKLD